MRAEIEEAKRVIERKYEQVRIDRAYDKKVHEKVIGEVRDEVEEAKNENRVIERK